MTCRKCFWDFFWGGITCREQGLHGTCDKHGESAVDVLSPECRP